MSVLITGGAGFIGINTAAELLINDKEVVIVDLPEASPIIDFLKNKFTNKLKYYSINLLDKDALDRVFSENIDIETVIHCAGYKNLNDDVNVPKYFENNIGITINLLEVMQKYNVKNIIFNSSSNVYENCIDMENTEDVEIILPNNVYGQSKVFIEQILRDLVNSDKSFKVSVLRIYNPIGIHPIFMGNFAYELLKNFEQLSTIIAKVLVGEKEQLEIYANEDIVAKDSYIRDYISMLDLAKLYNNIIDNFPSEFNIYNVGSGKGCSIMQFIEVFENISYKKVNYIIKKINRPIINRSVANINKIKEEFNWTPKYSKIEECSSDILKSFYEKR